ncbi:UvrD-helicase domain-containing protein [Acinetobacter sp. BSP-153]|uniref:UvrD-helicase domain-containing protein n=1 Tax=Acinetobacter sp. BSP-153 TaxID=3344663 RepID=UPI00376F6F2C
MPSLDFTLEQQRILDCTSENIIVSACAGSGKSSTLVEKAKREILLSRPWKKLAVLTFTNKSKDDLISKVNHPSIIITTFHSFIFENLFPFDPQVSDQLKEMFRVEADNYTKWLDILYNKKTIVGSKGKSDFVLEHAIKLCNKKNVQHFFKSKFHAIYIDEAQDNNIQQYQLIEFFIKLGVKILMVGDANQTLYGFRGACSNTFTRYFHDNRFSSYELKQNFRCHHIINRIANSYSFPDEHVYEENMGYFVININMLNQVVEKLVDESIVFLKKTNYDLSDHEGKFSILKDISFSPDLDDMVKKIVICLLKIKFKANYFMYNFLEELQIDIDKFNKNEIDFFKNCIEKYIYENGNSLDGALSLIGFSELNNQICETYSSLSQLEETKNFFQNTNKHVTMTIHSSKGLEFDNVILKRDDLYHNGELQKNNFYVSMTRARNRVLVIL